jgi:hypothetical protein
MRKFIAKAEKRRLTTGSYEDHIRNIRFLIGEAELISTFSDYAVIKKDDEYYKLTFERDASGVLRASGETKLEVRQYDATQTGALAKDLALEATDLFLKGVTAGIAPRLLEISGYLDGCQECAGVDIVQAMVGAPRFWKRLLADREPGVKRIISSKLESLARNRRQARFEKLYSNSSAGSASDTNAAASEVSKELNLVVERVKELETGLEKYAQVVASSKKTVQYEEDEQILERVDEFAQDLLADLKMLREKVLDIEVKNVSCAARLRDVLAEGLNFYEIACCFVETVASQLLKEGPRE